MPIRQLLSGFFLLFLGVCTGINAAPVKTPHVEAELIARNAAFQPGQPIEIALRLKIIDHWHTYWRNPGDSGLPTRVQWTLPPGFSAGEIAWPYPKKLPLGPLMNFGYEGEVLHLVAIKAPANLKAGSTVEFKAKADWLVCSDVCIPESADLTLTLPVVASAPLSDRRWVSSFSAANAALPFAATSNRGRARIANGQAVLSISAAPDLAPTTGEINFYPYTGDIIANAARQVRAQLTDQNTLQLSIPLAENAPTTLATLDGVLVSSSGWGKLHAGKAIAVSLPVTYGPAVAARAQVNPPASDMGLALALVFAFIGGVVLNLMPCVFPVLGIKIMGFAQNAQSAPAKLKQQGLAFLAGIVVSFWILALLLIVLRAAGTAVGWGFQLQSPLFVTLLATLFFLMALNLSGVFEVGLGVQAAAGDLDVRGSRGGKTDAFFSGVLATVVATPCTAPLMGAALGFTLSQPGYVGMLVFTAIALGMATPVVALSFFPAWLRHLPRSGAWMVTLRQFLAFPLFATVAWLAWVLGSQTGIDGVAKLLFGFVLIALGAWAYGRWQGRKPALATMFGLIALVCGLAIAWPGETSRMGNASASTEAGWAPFSRMRVAELRAEGKPVFIDFTATWCITCQVNKRVALNDTEVLSRFADMKIERVKADWTMQNPEITAALAEFGRNGVPLYVYYPPRGEAVVLPEILTPSIVLAAINTVGVARTAQK